MKEAEFKKIMKPLFGKSDWIDKEKVKALDDEVKEKICGYLVRRRLPVMFEMVTKQNYEWLSSCGYLYAYTNQMGYNMLCTSEQESRRKRCIEEQNIEENKVA